MSDMTPDDIAQRSFRTSFRGFDPDEVRSFLAAVSDAVETLAAELSRLLPDRYSPLTKNLTGN